MSPPLTVRLHELITTGDFGGLRPGMTRMAAHEQLGDPDDFGGMGTRDMMTAGFWRYGVMELHFYEDDTVWMLYTDHIGQHCESAALSVDDWILGPETTLQDVLEPLLSLQLPLTIDHTTDLILLTVRKTSVKMTFAIVPDQPTLTARFSSIQRT